MLSYGLKDENNEARILDKDGKAIPAQQVLSLFSGDRFQHLKGNPKILITQAQLIPSTKITPNNRPKYPDKPVITSASVMIILIIDQGLAPTDFRMPNSLFLSLIVISMILLTPTTPAIMVIILTSQLTALIPVNMPCISMNSFSTLKDPKAAASSG